MSTLLTVKLAELDPNAVKAFPIGSLFGNSTTADVYMVVSDGSQKKAVPIGGSAKYELEKHLENAYLIQKYDPLKFDKSTMWFKNQMMYVEPADATDAFITVQAETSPGSGVWEWRKILPISRADNIIIGKDASNRPRTLSSLIKEEGTRAIVRPTIEYEKAEKGEIHIKPDNSLWWKTGPDPSDDILLANSNEYIVDRLKKSIAIGENPPTHFDHNTLWVRDGADSGIMNSLTSSLYHTDTTLSTGLKLGKDSDNKGKLATVISDEGKVITIDLVSTEAFGHMITNYAFEPNTKSYLELTFHDPEEKIALLLLKGGYKQPTQDNMYGTELGEDSILITKAGSKFKNASTNKEMKFHNRTIFIMVDKTNTTASIKIGHVLDDGTLSYVYGTDTTAGFTQNVSNIGIASGTSSTPNSKAIVSIKSFKVRSIPQGYKGLNNVLPNETAFVNFAPLTNSQSVMLTNNQSLAELHAGGGRLITTPRSFEDRNVAKVHELLLDDVNKILYAKGKDLNLFPIGGANDDKFLKHLNYSMQVTSQRAHEVTKDNDDPSKAYISKATPFNIKAPNDQRLIRGNLMVIDNSTEGDKKTYKLVVPYNDTLSSYHDWLDFTDNTTPRYTDLKTYLEEVHKYIRKFLLTDSIYSSYEEFGYDDDYLKNNLATDSLFFREISTNKMINESLYIESVNQVTPGNEATARQIDKIFNAPANGVAEVYKNRDGSLTIKLLTSKGIMYTANMTSNYKITSWNQGIFNVGTETEIPIDLKVKGKSYFEGDIESKGWSILNGGIWSERPNWFFTAKNVASGINQFNVLRYQGTKAAGDTSVILGHDDNWDYIGFESKNKPYWLRKNSDGSFTKEYWLLQSDIDRAWNYKGSLLKSGQVIDLNNLKDQTAVGYYILSSDISKKASNYPEENQKGFLEVGKEDNVIIQRYTSIGDRVSVHTRVWDGTRWSDWDRTANKKELELKFDVAGGTITGATTFNDRATFKNVAYFGNTANLKEGINTAADSAFGSSEAIMRFNKDGQNKKFTKLGARTIESFDFDTNSVPTWIKPGGIKAKLALQEDLQRDIDNLANNYTNNTELTKLLNKKVNEITYTEDKKNFMKRNGDTATGNYTFTNGMTSFEDGSTLNASRSILKLPSKIYSTTVADTKEEFAKGGFTTGVFSYRTPRSDAPYSTVIGFKNESENTNYPSNLYFRLYNNGELEFTSSNDNGTTVKDFRKVVTHVDVKNDFLGGSGKVASADIVKSLHSMTVGRNRGALNTFYDGTTYNIDKFIKLEPGNYYINSDTDLTKLNLDKNKISNEGILVSYGENGVNGKSYMYIPMSNKAQNENKLAFLNMKGKDTNTKWIYVSDDSAFISEERVKQLINSIKEEILSKIMSMKYRYTGNTDNISIPYRLVHTHNQYNLPGVDNNQILTFYTNIDLGTNGLNNTTSVVNIELKGYSEGTGYPIHVILTAHLGMSGANLVITKKDEYHVTPGAIVASTEIEDNKLVFKINDAISNQGLSFDTYVRISNTRNYTFKPEVTHYKVGTGAKVESKKLLTENYNHLNGVFTNR